MTDSKIVPNDKTLRFYFYFMQERMAMFWRRLNGTSANLTNDNILKGNKFTNVYRACDRVSQYLIRNVIYKNLDYFTPQDVLLRILIFKIFNRIETWEYLESFLGEPITIKSFHPNRISLLLSQRQVSAPIFSNAYMMAGSHTKYNHLTSKHEKWLELVKVEFVEQNMFDRILDSESLSDVYDLLRGCSLIGDFLAYQYAIDFNYSPFVNFNENTFVKAGIGAVRGIKKCFESYGGSYEDAIRYVQDNIELLQGKYGFTDFSPLPNRKPTLIDLQNCFCETDKYLRVKMPDLVVGNTRIKQKYTRNTEEIQFLFPPKWNIPAII